MSHFVYVVETMHSSVISSKTALSGFDLIPVPAASLKHDISGPIFAVWMQTWGNSGVATFDKFSKYVISNCIFIYSCHLSIFSMTSSYFIPSVHISQRWNMGKDCLYFEKFFYLFCKKL